MIDVSNLELYSSWGTKINYRAFYYLAYPKEALASLSSAPLLILILIFVVSLIFWIHFYRKLLRFNFIKLTLSKIVFLILLIGTSITILIRGGLQEIPINQSYAYYSKTPFINHCTVNTEWNLVYSILNVKTSNSYHYLTRDEANDRVSKLYSPPDTSTLHVLKQNRPNIILIILESFTSDLVSELGGLEGATPMLSELIRGGLLFNQIYANGDRTDYGLISILSGFPSLPNISIISQPEKFEKLPTITSKLKVYNYATSFYYGGDLAFGNLNAYLQNARFDKITEKYDFKNNEPQGKWGYHDHIVLEKVATDLDKSATPFFTAVLTLSSHEPFEVPLNFPVYGNSIRDKFIRVASYTDFSLKLFFEKAKTKPWYEHTLFVLLADHGHPAINQYPSYAPGKFKIPLLFYGNVIRESFKGTTIEIIGSQTDLIQTLYSQLGIQQSEFTWSKNLLSKHTPGFAFYTFNDGFGWTDKRGQYAFDNISKKILFSNPVLVNEDSLKNGQAFIQAVMDEYGRK